jgi:hypothetical protein
MNGTSGFQEVRSFFSRSTSYRFLQEQRHRITTSHWSFFRNEKVPAPSTGSSVERETALAHEHRFLTPFSLLGTVPPAFLRTKE